MAIISLLFCLLNISSSSAASDFVPYTFHPSSGVPSAAQEKTFSQSNWDLSIAPITEYSPDGDTTIRLFTEVADLLISFRNHSGAGIGDALSFQCKTPSLDFSYLDNGDDSCGTLKSSLAAASSAIHRACSLVESPEQVGSTVPLTTLDPNQVQSLETQVPVLLAPELQLEFPVKLIPIPHALLLRSALRKIFQAPIAINLDGAVTQTQSAIQQAKGSSCALANRVGQDLQASLAALQNAKDLMEKSKTVACANLPYPSLTKQERQIFSMYYGAITWRNRGGGPWKLDGTNTARRTWAGIPFRILAQLNGSTHGEEVGNAMVDRLQLKGWKDWWNMGQGDGHDKYSDLMNMTERGVYQIGVGAPYSFLGLFAGGSADKVLQKEGFQTNYWRMAGMQFGNCYYDALLINKTEHIGDKWPSPLVSFLDGNTSLAELCAGAVFGIGLSKSLLQNQNCQ